jgi:hypothetical protein
VTPEIVGNDECGMMNAEQTNGQEVAAFIVHHSAFIISPTVFICGSFSDCIVEFQL